MFFGLIFTRPIITYIFHHMTRFMTMRTNSDGTFWQRHPALFLALLALQPKVRERSTGCRKLNTVISTTCVAMQNKYWLQLAASCIVPDDGRHDAVWDATQIGPDFVLFLIPPGLFVNVTD